MESDGKHFKETLKALKLEGGERDDAVRNASKIVAKIIKAYSGKKDATAIDPATTPNAPPTGLVYGRIQSGKTRAMIATTAMAFDNGFRISIVMTSNINDLVSQTHGDFIAGVPGQMVFQKDDDLKKEVPNAKFHLEQGYPLLVICSKGTTSLKNVSEFLKAVDANKYPAIIFDDEGDQASLDTNTAKRGRSSVAVAPSAINDAIQTKLRPALPKHVYVSVTGTPQAVLLQSADSSHRPSFIEPLPPGGTYIGGDSFFKEELPENNDKLISLVDQNEKQQLLSGKGGVPAGLKRALLFFLVSGAAATAMLGARPKGYSFLCHPSLENKEQGKAETRIIDFLTEVAKVLGGMPDNDEILPGLDAAYEELKKSVPTGLPTLQNLKTAIQGLLPSKKILVINFSVKRQGIAYGAGLNFLIGGNTLGRGIAIRDLLVTYYVREAKVSQIDTMHQHARMYGYRSPTLQFTRLFIPRHLYFRFRDIHESDTDLRAFIEKNAETPETFPVQYNNNLRPTRPGVLDVNRTGTINPGMHLYPNYYALPQAGTTYEKILAELRTLFGLTTEDEVQMEPTGQTGVDIDWKTAVRLARMIKTGSKNSWRDSTIGTVIEKVATELGGNVTLRYRTLERTVKEKGFIESGALFGGRLEAARASDIPTLWLMAATTLPDSEKGPGLKFIYPTFVIPRAFKKLYLFNRGN